MAAILTMMLVPGVIRIASALGSIDYPGRRRDHSRPTPRLGGVAIMGGIGLGTLAALIVQGRWTAAMGSSDLRLFAGSIFVIFLLGLLDDTRGASVTFKFGVQLAVATVVVAAGWSFQGVHVPFVGGVEFGPVVGAVLSILWLVGITNAINLVDGLDGLASGITAIIAATLMVFAALHGDLLATLITAAMAGACLGFLRFNWAPARIFMGDSGSLPLGFMLASVSLHSSLKSSAAVAILVPFLALGLPAIDALLVMLVRFSQQEGSVTRRAATMFNADRNHLHHVLLKAAPQRHRVVLTLYVLALGGCLMAFAVVISKSANLGYALLAVEILAVALIRITGVDQMAGAKALSMRERLLRALLGNTTHAEPVASEVASEVANEAATQVDNPDLERVSIDSPG